MKTGVDCRAIADVLDLLQEIRERSGRVRKLEEELEHERQSMWRAVAAAHEAGAPFTPIANLTGTSRQYTQWPLGEAREGGN